MVDRLGFHQVGPGAPGPPAPAPAAPPTRPDRGPSFADALQQQLDRQGELRFSGHAQERLRQRSIQLSRADMDRLQEAIGKAEAKGAKESLVLMDDLALVVSIRNRTVITAVDQANRKESVFTNIDSVVITQRAAPPALP